MLNKIKDKIKLNKKKRSLSEYAFFVRRYKKVEQIDSLSPIKDDFIKHCSQWTSKENAELIYETFVFHHIDLKRENYASKASVLNILNTINTINTTMLLDGIFTNAKETTEQFHILKWLSISSVGVSLVSLIIALISLIG